MPLLVFCCSVTQKQIGVDEVLLAVFFVRNQSALHRKSFFSSSQHWLVVFRPSPLKNDGEIVSWDDEIPNTYIYIYIYIYIYMYMYMYIIYIGKIMYIYILCIYIYIYILYVEKNVPNHQPAKMVLLPDSWLSLGWSTGSRREKPQFLQM